MEDFIIRRIRPMDNAVIKKIVQTVILEKGVPKIGSAYSDNSLDDMYSYYQNVKGVYYVVESDGRVVGGGGIGPLENGDGFVCELQKMYFLGETRGRGIGTILLKRCLEDALVLGYNKCYLETMPNMEAAQAVYQKFGFYYLNEPLGCTGHTACPVWMMKDL